MPTDDVVATAHATFAGTDLQERFDAVRWTTEALLEPLSAEDCAVQSMPEASPAKWHLAHTTWFFETFVLVPGLPGYELFHPRFGYLFNSYYNAVGERHPRPQRGLLTRPSLDKVLDYRAHVDKAVLDLLATELPPELARAIEIGLHHEQQHQELLLTDIKHLFFCNPLRPEYRSRLESASARSVPSDFVEFAAGVRAFGHRGESFCYDNEQPRHRQYCHAFRIADRLVTNGEWKDFIADDGYKRPELWLSDGWDCLQSNRWEAPLYWSRTGGTWESFTLAGARPVDDAEPVCHVSFYEADAFARWCGKRLPTEFEWELACENRPIDGNLLESARFHPASVDSTVGASSSDSEEQTSPAIRQLFGDVWEWTASPYVAYPGYRAPDGALGEYNGKFMSNQMVLRGGSCATPASHIRATYRNFFPPAARWQFMGLRLAEDA